VKKQMKWKDWRPPGGFRASWCWQPSDPFTEREAILGAALDRLVLHTTDLDRNTDVVLHAKRVLKAISGLDYDKVHPNRSHRPIFTRLGRNVVRIDFSQMSRYLGHR
jgi:hypothetical protein